LEERIQSPLGSIRITWIRFFSIREKYCYSKSGVISWMKVNEFALQYSMKVRRNIDFRHKLGCFFREWFNGHRW
jgi:hypothetical protein